MDHYLTIETQAVAEYKDRGSKFLAYSFPLKRPEEFKKYLQALKKEHPKAVHYCFAYRTGFDGNNFRVSDDREPAGTAGKQILGQVDSKSLTNILVVVVRYFGGTLLGVPGLITAYKTATSYVLQCTPVTQKAIEINYNLQFDYTIMNDVMQIMKQCNCTVHKNELQLFCKMEVGIPKEREEETINSLKKLYNVEFQKTE
ncbi:MAG: YigZ family protein [Bacteroidota bacterium]|nr:YigZ family protein [Bacteroidota bacterium]